MLTRNSCVSVRVSSHLPVHIYLPGTCGRLVEVTEDLARYVFPASFLMVHNTRRGGEDHKAERTSRKHCRHPLLHLAQRNGVTWRDNTTLVETANKLDHDLAGAVVINDFKVTNVACTVLVHLIPIFKTKQDIRHVAAITGRAYYARDRMRQR